MMRQRNQSLWADLMWFLLFESFFATILIANPRFFEGQLFGGSAAILGFVAVPIGGIVAFINPRHRNPLRWIAGCAVGCLVSLMVTPVAIGILYGIGLAPMTYASVF